MSTDKSKSFDISKMTKTQVKQMTEALKENNEPITLMESDKAFAVVLTHAEYEKLHKMASRLEKIPLAKGELQIDAAKQKGREIISQLKVNLIPIQTPAEKPPEHAIDEAVLTNIRQMMTSLGGFYGAESDCDEDKAWVDVRMIPGNEANLELIKRKFPEVAFIAESYMIEPQAAELPVGKPVSERLTNNEEKDLQTLGEDLMLEHEYNKLEDQKNF